MNICCIYSTFPVGEVFSEPKDLERVNGSVVCWGFPNLDRIVETCVPFELQIVQGRVVHISHSAPKSFLDVMKVVEDGEGELVIRELGIGLNKAMNKSNHVNDLTAFERQYGVHISVGKKHTVFKKAGMSRKASKARFHIDLFLDVDTVVIDGKTVFSISSDSLTFFNQKSKQ